MDAKRLGMTQRDMEFARGLEWSVEDVSRAFGVPKVFLSEMEDATLANVETLERFLWRNTVVPELRLIEDGLNRALTPLFNAFEGQYRIAFDLRDIEALQESEATRAGRVVQLVEAGILSVDEAREEYGLPPA